MDIKEETQKIGGNPLLRYAILVIGLLIMLFSEGVLTWKGTSQRDAAGNVAAIELDIAKLKQKIEDKDSSSDDKKEWREEIKDLRENELKDARMEAAEEGVDAQNGTWFWSMVRHLGGTLTCIGLLVVAATGGNHEKVGALVALGLILSRI